MNRLKSAPWQRFMYGAILVVALLYTIAPRWGEEADIWETAATIEAASDSPLNPRNPLLDLPGETSPRFTPYTIVWGVIDRLFDLPLFTTVAIAGLLNILLFVTGLARVIRTLTTDSRAILWIVPVMLIGWGRGYGEANAYQAEFFFALPGLVGTFAYGICFHGLAELNHYLVSGSRARLTGYIALSLLAFLSHPITALFLFVAAFGWAVARVSIGKTLLLQLVPVGVLLVSLWWPYFDYSTLLFRGSTEAWYKVRLFDGQVMKIGPVLLGLPIAAFFAVRRKYPELVIALGCSLAIYLLSWLAGVQIGSRFIFYGAIFAHMCIGLFLWDSGLFTRGFFQRSKTHVLIVLFLVMAVFIPGIYYRAHKIVKQWSPVIVHYKRTSGDILEPWQDLNILRNRLDKSSIVMVEDTVGWRVPAVTGARLVAQAKGNPLIQEEVNQRRADATSFFNDPLETADRWLLLSKYRCTHILVDERNADWNDKSLKQDLGVLANPILLRSPYRLYSVKKSF